MFDGLLHNLQTEEQRACEVEYGAAGADELKALIEQAHDQSRKDFPDTALFDGVTVHYDKSSTGSANNR